MQKSVNIGGKLLSFENPLVMGILNVTDDSFFDGSRSYEGDKIVDKVKQFVAEGVDVIDVGGYSTRPFADDIPVEEEVERVCRAIEIIRQIAPQMPISVDTFRAIVVKKVFDKFGAFIVNDVSGGTMDEEMFDTVAKCKLPYILGHMKGTPMTMTSMNQYHDMMAEIVEFFVRKIENLRGLGVVDIIIDPCFGFAKNVDQNFELLKKLDYLSVLELPILVGLSRKSMIFKTLEVQPKEALAGTIALNWQALVNGANIVRVHDVREAKQIVKLFEKYVQA